MSNYRFNLLLAFFGLIALLALLQIFTINNYLSEPVELILHPGRDTGAVRLRHWEGRPFLADSRNNFRKHGRGRLVNPLVLSREELLEYSRSGENRKVWLVFSRLYCDYYKEFYRERFDRRLNRFDREVQLAYDYWKRQAP